LEQQECLAKLKRLCIVTLTYQDSAEVAVVQSTSVELC